MFLQEASAKTKWSSSLDPYLLSILKEQFQSIPEASKIIRDAETTRDSLLKKALLHTTPKQDFSYLERFCLEIPNLHQLSEKLRANFENGPRNETLTILQNWVRHSYLLFGGTVDNAACPGLSNELETLLNEYLFSQFSCLLAQLPDRSVLNPASTLFRECVFP